MKSESNGIGGIGINIFDAQEKLVSKILSEGDEYFSYLGLMLGPYTAKLEKEQLTRLNLAALEV